MKVGCDLVKFRNVPVDCATQAVEWLRLYWLRLDPLERSAPRRRCLHEATIVRIQSQPLAHAHCSTSRCPPTVTIWQVSVSQSQPISLSHCNTSRFPSPTALSHTHAAQSQPFARAYCSTARSLHCAAAWHVSLLQVPDDLRMHVLLAQRLGCPDQFCETKFFILVLRRKCLTLATGSPESTAKRRRLSSG
jgi:hypothetical protein